MRSESGQLDGPYLSFRRFQREGRRRLYAAAGGIHVVDNAPSRTSSLAASTSTIEIPVTCYQVYWLTPRIPCIYDFSRFGTLLLAEVQVELVGCFDFAS